MKRFIHHIIPVTLLLLAWVAVVVTNFHPGTWLTGWDNLHPEFNFPLNISRSVFAVWQEYQGLGLLGGMGHAAALPRELILWLASMIIPAQYIRYTWTFGMLLIGVLGTYVLIRHILRETHSDTTSVTAATIGALYFLFNLATVQTFFAPFEAFITHYGFLPWLIWGDLMFLEKPTRRRTLCIIALHIISATQAYIPTLFVVYSIILACICMHTFIGHYRDWFTMIKRIAILTVIIFCTNAYWILPFGFFTVTQSQVTVNAKINQMATDQIYERNKAYGSLWDTLTLRGFWYSNTDLNPQTNQMELMMSDWIQLEKYPIVTISRLVVVALILFGVLSTYATPSLWIWTAITALGFTIIAANTAPFSWIDNILRSGVPLLKQFFRFPYTKWSIELALGYAIMLGIGVSRLITMLKKHVITQRATIVILAVLPIISTLGILQGHLISSRVEVQIPEAYNQTFAYFSTKPAGRIATLPQPSYWDWKYYQWGQLGSGFPWYGIQQPILDRTFDVWSSQNENYYWEISYAIYQKNPQILANVLHKYDVRYIVIDSSLVLTSNNRALFVDDTNTLLEHIPDYKRDRTFGTVTIYERTSPNDQSFITLTNALPSIGPNYTRTDNDVAYELYGNYKSPTGNTDTIIFPYRSLFSKRSVTERNFQVTDTGTTIDISSTSSKTPDSVSIDTAKDLAYSTTEHPEALSQDAYTPCGILANGHTSAIQRLDQNQPTLRLQSSQEPGCISVSASTLDHTHAYLVRIHSRHISGRPLMISLINQTAKHVEVETYLPEFTSWQTTYLILPPLATDGLGYTAYITNDSIGNIETINDISTIDFYTFPYQEMVRSHTGMTGPIPSARLPDTVVTHPNPAYYRVIIRGLTEKVNTLILSQSYDPNWNAYELSCSADSILCRIKESLPFVFGKKLLTHTEINNWENGWELPSGSGNTIVIFYLPQLLEFAGFILLGITAAFVYFKKADTTA